ncbi:hypothetical protein, partial [Pseudomonas syringae]
PRRTLVLLSHPLHNPTTDFTAAGNNNEACATNELHCFRTTPAASPELLHAKKSMPLNIETRQEKPCTR